MGGALLCRQGPVARAPGAAADRGPGYSGRRDGRMIPQRLELTNFLAYRQPAPLDFTGMHVAVLCGENGAGKSSLLDALTWALWGRARAKTDTELVHQGQTEMRVEFTFALGEQQYKVVRARKVGKGAQSLLDFQAAGPDGKLASIGEATIPKTQE